MFSSAFQPVTAMLEALLFGALAGAAHVLTGPDHMAAIAPLAVRPLGAWVRGFLWGVGHTSGVWAVGLVAMLAQGLLPLQLMSSWGDRLAAGALILVGVWALIRGRVDARRPVTCANGDTQIRLRVELHAASGFGILHGLAGSSHYFGILPALGFASPLQGCTYLAAFGLSTIMTMTGLAGLLGIAAGMASVRRWLAPVAGGLAVVVGIVWLGGQRF